MLQQREAGGFQDLSLHRSPNSRTIQWRDIFHRAESLYDTGEYEQALVWYHRGRRLKPNAREFIKGISKCEQAIANKCPLVLQDLGTHSGKSNARSVNSKRVRFPEKSAGTRTTTSHQTEDYGLDDDLDSDMHHVVTLNKDKKYLQDFLKELDIPTRRVIKKKKGSDVKQLLQTGLHYLDTRTTFWKQNMPAHALEILQTRPPTIQSSSGALMIEQGSDNPSNSLLMTLLKEMMKTNQEFINRQFLLCIPRCESCITILKKMKSSDVDNKYDILANLYSVMGNSYFELEKYQQSLKCYTKDLEIARERDLSDARSRALENMGRVYARVGEFDAAIHVWKEKVGLCNSHREQAWLYHEIGYCYLSKMDYFSAKQYGALSMETAQTIVDSKWELNATILTGQAEAKMKNYTDALKTFKKAASMAENIGDGGELKAIKDSIRSLEKALTKQKQERNLSKPVPPPQLSARKISLRDTKSAVSQADVLKISYFEKKDDETESHIELSSLPSNSLKTSVINDKGNKVEENPNGLRLLENAVNNGEPVPSLARKDTFTPLQYQSKGLNNSHYFKPHANLAQQTLSPIMTRLPQTKTTTNTPINASRAGVKTEEPISRNQTNSVIPNISVVAAENNFPKLKVHHNNFSPGNINPNDVYQEMLPATTGDGGKNDLPNQQYSWKSKHNFQWKAHNQPKKVFSNQKNGSDQNEFPSLSNRSDNQTPVPHSPPTPKSSMSDNLTLMLRKSSAQNNKYSRSQTVKPVSHNQTITSSARKEAIRNKYLNNDDSAPTHQSLPNISVTVKHKPVKLNAILPPFVTAQPYMNTIKSREPMEETIETVTKFPQLHQGNSNQRRRYMSPRIEGVGAETERKPVAKKEGKLKVIENTKEIDINKGEKDGNITDMDLLKMLLDM